MRKRGDVRVRKRDAVRARKRGRGSNGQLGIDTWAGEHHVEMGKNRVWEFEQT